MKQFSLLFHGQKTQPLKEGLLKLWGLLGGLLGGYKQGKPMNKALNGTKKLKYVLLCKINLPLTLSSNG